MALAIDLLMIRKLRAHTLYNSLFLIITNVCLLNQPELN